jgi:hypothetical protein
MMYAVFPASIKMPITDRKKTDLWNGIWMQSAGSMSKDMMKLTTLASNNDIPTLLKLAIA